MDEIVLAALNKWPNVPHCYGWLALDARGDWRMRDERAQALELAGDKIRNPALLGFINRNYQHDEQGHWYFQNGPQRVYVDLEATPYIAKTAPDAGLLLHTGAVLSGVTEVFLSTEGKLMLRAGTILAQLDDRDLANCLDDMQINGAPVQDEALLAWLTASDSATALATLSIQLSPQAAAIEIRHAELSQVMLACGYLARPRPTLDKLTDEK